MSKQEILLGDCIAVMKTLPDASIDAIVTDPPYGMSKEPDIAEVLRHWLAGDVYAHGGGGFMGKSWDSFVPGPEYWRECLRVLKPGGHLVAFSSTRTSDLQTIAIRMAGFEIRDSISYDGARVTNLDWMYGSGFPKSLDVSKAIDDSDAKKWQGWGTALKPAHEPIVLARKPLIGTVAQNVLMHGTGALNIDACRIEGPSSSGGNTSGATALGQGSGWNEHENRPTTIDRSMSSGRWPANVILVHGEECSGTECAENCPIRRLDEQTGTDCGARASGPTRSGESQTNTRNKFAGTGNDEAPFHADTGGASRFYYCAKTSKSEREAGLEHMDKKSGAELTDSKEGQARLDSPRTGAGRSAKVFLKLRSDLTPEQIEYVYATLKTAGVNVDG